MYEENRAMCILQTQSVTLIFLYFCYPHEPESGKTSNKLYTQGKINSKNKKKKNSKLGLQNTQKKGSRK